MEINTITTSAGSDYNFSYKTKLKLLRVEWNGATHDNISLDRRDILELIEFSFKSGIIEIEELNNHMFDNNL